MVTTDHPTMPARRPSGAPTTVVDDRALPAVTAVLVKALRELGRAGRPRTANRLAAQAWSALRVDHPRQAEHINGVMHYLARIDDSPIPYEEDTVPTDTELDVRTEPPARRHQLIFDTYTSLSGGSAFVLVNDHDPKPLYYQFEAEHTGEFTWDYLEQGPQVWRVRIGRAA